MANEGLPENLTQTIERLNSPIKTSDDIQIISMTLDAIAGALLRDPLMVKRLGSERASKLFTASPELSQLLRAVGGELFELAAAAAARLMTIARTSFVDFDSEDEEIADVNAARIQLHDYLLKALASIYE